MDIQITTRHFKGSQELQENLVRSVEKLGRFNDTIQSVHVILDAEKKNVRSVELIFNIYGRKVCVSSTDQNMHKALESVLLKAERQLKKENRKRKDHKSQTISDLVTG